MIGMVLLRFSCLYSSDNSDSYNRNLPHLETLWVSRTLLVVFFLPRCPAVGIVCAICSTAFLHFWGRTICSPSELLSELLLQYSSPSLHRNYWLYPLDLPSWLQQVYHPSLAVILIWPCVQWHDVECCINIVSVLVFNCSRCPGLPQLLGGGSQHFSAKYDTFSTPYFYFGHSPLDNSYGPGQTPSF